MSIERRYRLLKSNLDVLDLTSSIATGLPVPIVNSAGNWTIPAPTSGATLLINGLDNTSIVTLKDTTATNGINMNFQSPGVNQGYIGFGPAAFTAGVPLTDFGLSSGNGGALRFAVAGGTQTVMTMSAAGRITTTALTTTNTIYALNVFAPNTAGASFGLATNAGTNSTDFALNIANAANTTNYLLVRGDGLVQMGGGSASPGGVLCGSIAALTTGAGASTGTLTNAPSAGNPTKWIKINDAGTIRSIPAW